QRSGRSSDLRLLSQNRVHMPLTIGNRPPIVPLWITPSLLDYFVLPRINTRIHNRLRNFPTPYIIIVIPLSRELHTPFSLNNTSYLLLIQPSWYIRHIDTTTNSINRIVYRFIWTRKFIFCFSVHQ